MSSLGVALVTLSPHSSRPIERHGQRVMLLFSLTFMAAGMIMLTLLPVWGGIANVLAGICIFGVGFGLIVAPATSVVMVAIPKEKAGDGSAVNMLSRQIGGAVGVAITGSLASAITAMGYIVRVPTDRATAERGRAVAQRRDRAEQPTRGSTRWRMPRWSKVLG